MTGSHSPDMLAPVCIQQYTVLCMRCIHQAHYSFYRCYVRYWEKKRLCPCSPPTTQTHKYYAPPCPWGVSFAWATGVRCDTHSPLLLYNMLWKCEHGSVVVVCLALGTCMSFHTQLTQAQVLFVH